MHIDTNSQQFSEKWSLTFDESEFIQTQPEKAWLDFAVNLIYFRNEGVFPSRGDDVPGAVIEYLHSQIGSAAQGINWLPQQIRTARRRRVLIKKFYKISAADQKDLDKLRGCLNQKHIHDDIGAKTLQSEIPMWCFNEKIECLSDYDGQRLSTSVIAAADDRTLEQVYGSLCEQTIGQLNASLEEYHGTPTFAALKADPSGVAVDTFIDTVRLVEFIESLELPYQTIRDFAAKI